ncbi:ABC transporter permease [Candidatus Epulonipiscium fishelsonii]|uniref:ABC transporter permease n=1 Tax=Candidatus Epulonipiscium fishelsonii TaxID=77094 RepID=A0ACC8X9E3_9FIRM|nr:ABC transporter permease [Epulopiscium sp. SCG-B11WGA-EpuloA1]ONI41867.1 ABC transporter permease [Epulopiscium sp. SCG-B05WGA-EpuloA1]
MILLFGLFFILLIIGTSIANSMFISSIIYMIYYGLPLEMIPQRMAAGVDSFTLLAVIFFVLAGALMNRGGITTRIFTLAEKCVGHYTGGLAHANVLASIIFAGMSGSAIADTGGLGAIELKAMKDGGYDEDFSLAITGASSLIGPVIPPSVPLVLFGVTASQSVGDLFNAGIIPGILLGIIMMVVNYFICRKRNYGVSPKASLKEVLKCFIWAFWAIFLVVIIRGGIAFGVFTPTEAAVIAVAYAIILGLIYKAVKIKELPSVIKETLGTSVSVLYILSAATLFSWILTYEQIPQTIAGYLIGLTDNALLLLLIIMLILLFVGLFMDITPAIVILTPILLPAVSAVGIDLIWFGVIMILCLLVGLITPPVGMVLFVLSGISDVPIAKISRAIAPYLVASIGVILLIIFYVYLMTLNPSLPKLY